MIKNNSGFTIVETLIAVVVVTAAILGATSAVQTGLSSYIQSKDQIVAFYLAQEGFEQIRNLRDENRLNGRNWLTGIALASSDPCYFDQACTVSPIEGTVAIRCPSPGNCPFLRKEPSTGFMAYSGAWPLTTFKREIRFISISSNEVAVTVTVDWSKGTVERQFKAKSNLLNW